jgi:hypothetical protein
MPDIYWDTDPPLMRIVQVQEDTAGTKYYAEFEPGSTAPVRTWVEHATPRRYIYPSGKPQNDNEINSSSCI